MTKQNDKTTQDDIRLRTLRVILYINMYYIIRIINMYYINSTILIVRIILY